MSTGENQLLRVAVIGVGTIGSQHARVYSDLEGVRLVAVADTNKESGERIAARYHARWFARYQELLEREDVDLVSVAVPTDGHCSIATETLSAGIHTLVEKPIAATVQQARQIRKAADSTGAKVTVGHIDRFNPAIRELQRRVRAGDIGRILQVHARRLGPYPTRVEDVGVLMDLATHDIDTFGFLLSSEARRVYAEVESHTGRELEDLVMAIIRFTNGVLGILDVNWLTPTTVRQLTVLGEGGMFVTNTRTQELYWHKNASPAPVSKDPWESLDLFRGVSEGDTVKVQLPTYEPLRSELEAFVTCVREDTDPVVSAEEATNAVHLASQLLASARKHQAIDPRVVTNG